MKHIQINTPTKGIQQYTLTDKDSNHIYIYDKLGSEPVTFSILHTNGSLYDPSSWDTSENDNAVGVVVYYPFGSPFIFKGFYYYGQGPLSWAYSNPEELIPLSLFESGGIYENISIPAMVDEVMGRNVEFISTFHGLSIRNPNETSLMSDFTDLLASDFSIDTGSVKSVLQQLVSQTFKNGKKPRGALIKELIIINGFWEKLKELVSMIGYDFWPTTFSTSYPSYSTIQPFMSTTNSSKTIWFTYFWQSSGLLSSGMYNMYKGALSSTIPSCLPLITDF